MGRLTYLSGAIALMLLFGCIGGAREGPSGTYPPRPVVPDTPGSLPQVGDSDLSIEEEEDLDFLPDEELIPPPEPEEEGPSQGSGGSIADKLDYSDLLVEEGSEFDSDLINEGDIIEPI